MGGSNFLCCQLGPKVVIKAQTIGLSLSKPVLPTMFVVNRCFVKTFQRVGKTLIQQANTSLFLSDNVHLGQWEDCYNGSILI